MSTDQLSSFFLFGVVGGGGGVELFCLLKECEPDAVGTWAAIVLHGDSEGE